MTQPKLQQEVLEKFLNKLKEDESFDDELVEGLREVLTSASKVKPADLVAVFAREDELK
jgi:hypothetical protein